MKNKFNINNKYIIGGICLVVVIFIGILFMFSRSYAFEGIGEFKFICDKSIALGGSTIECEIRGEVLPDKKIVGIESWIELTDNLEFVEFKTDEEMWQGGVEEDFWEYITVFDDNPKEGEFYVGTLKVKLKDGVINTTEYIKLKNNIFSDDNFKNNVIEDVSVEIKTPQITSDVYDFSKEYIISDTKNIATIIDNVDVDGCSVGVNSNGSIVTEGSIVEGSKLVAYVDDTILKEFSIVYFESEIYDLSKDYIFSSVKDLYEDINNGDDIKFINCGVSVKTGDLVISYNSSDILTYDILNIYSDLYKIDFNNNYIFINEEINQTLLDNISKTDNITLEINNDNLDILYNGETVKSLKILYVFSAKYDINLDEGFIYTKGDNSSDIKGNIQSNASSLNVKDNKLNIMYNNKTIMDLDIVSITSNSYKISYDKGYIYTNADNSLSLFKENINLTNSDIFESNGKLQLKHNDVLVDEFNLYYIESSLYKIIDNNIYIKGAMDYETFTTNIEFNGLSYEVQDASSNVVTSGNVEENYKVKLLLNNDELVTYTVKAEYLEISDELFVLEDKKIIYRVAIGTKVGILKNKIDTSGTVEFYDNEGSIITDDSRVLGTSYSVKITLSSETVEYKFSVVGDVASNGKIDISDVPKLYAHYTGELAVDKKLNDEEKLAGDITGDGIIGPMDVNNLYIEFRANAHPSKN